MDRNRSFECSLQLSCLKPIRAEWTFTDRSKVIEMRSKVKVTVTRIWNATLRLPKIHPHTKSWMSMSSNIGYMDLLWIICVIYVLCFSCFCVCSLLPCGHLGRLTSWFLFVMFNCVFLSLYHVVSWVRCGT